MGLISDTKWAAARAAALRALISKLPAMVNRREYAAVLGELQVHSRHIEELRELREQFLKALVGLELPLLPMVERVLYDDFRRAIHSTETAIVSQLHVLLLRRPLRQFELQETVTFISDVNMLSATHQHQCKQTMVVHISYNDEPSSSRGSPPPHGLDGGEGWGGHAQEEGKRDVTVQQNVACILAAGRRCQSLEHRELGDAGDGGWVGDDGQGLGAGWKVRVLR